MFTRFFAYSLAGQAIRSVIRSIASHKPTFSPAVINSSLSPIILPPDIGLVRGQSDAKLALIIAAAGRHNVLLIGPPGEGKSFLASTIPGFLPTISQDELQSLRETYSYSSIPLRHDASGRILRPYRAIGPTITEASLIGGGRSRPIPGEIALAHTGVLFLDELPQFGRRLIDTLRQPLESGYVSITRNGYSTSFPCEVILIAAMNPCPCGYYGVLAPAGSPQAGSHLCRCSPSAITKYQSQISGAILDRIDLVTELSQLSDAERFAEAIQGQSQYFLDKVCYAQDLALSRQASLNCQIGPALVFDLATNPLRFTHNAIAYFRMESSKPRYSTRRTVRLARISRTIADLAAKPDIHSRHIQLARQFTDSSLMP